MCPSSWSTPTRLGARQAVDMTPWVASWTQRPCWPDPATRCCWLRDARPWTCSPTTPREATRSPPPYDAGTRARTEGRAEGSEGDDHREPRGRHQGQHEGEHEGEHEGGHRSR